MAWGSGFLTGIFGGKKPAISGSGTVGGGLTAADYAYIAAANQQPTYSGGGGSYSGGGSYGGGGSYVNPYGPEAMAWYEGQQPDPLQSPAYLAYIASLDQESAGLDSERKLRTSMYGTERERLLDNLKREFDNPGGIMDRLRGAFEERGAIRSGAYLAQQQRQNENRSMQSGAVGAQYQQQVSQMEIELAQRLQDINRRRAEAAVKFSVG